MDIQELSKYIVELFEKLSHWEESVVKDSGLTTAQAHTIEIVGHAGPLKMKDLAEKMGVTTGTLTVGIDRLEKKKLLKRRPHDTDRRAYLIELTGAGKKCFEEHHRFHLHMTRELVSGLTREEQDCLGRLIRKMVDRI